MILIRVSFNTIMLFTALPVAVTDAPDAVSVTTAAPVVAVLFL